MCDLVLLLLLLLLLLQMLHIGRNVASDPSKVVQSAHFVQQEVSSSSTSISTSVK